MARFHYKPSRWIARFDSPAEREMRGGFISRVDEIYAEAEAYRKDGETLFVGLEVELPLAKDDLSLAPQSTRDQIVSLFPKVASAELGGHQLEIINDPPCDILRRGIRSPYDDLHATSSQVRRKLRETHSQIVRMGAFPLVSPDEVAYTAGKPQYEKYRRSPQWHRAHRRRGAIDVLPGADNVDVSNPLVVGLMNAVHVSIDADGFCDAVDKLNRALMIAPLALAMAANATHLNGRDTGYADVRSLAWEASHDTRSSDELRNGRQTRVGMPPRYYDCLDDFFNRVLSYPFVLHDLHSLKHPFETGMGLYWRDARLKFLRNKKTVAVEFRPIPLQPTLREDVGIAMFFVGRLLWSQHHREWLLPIDLVRTNKHRATQLGSKAHLFFRCGHAIKVHPAPEVLAMELDRAEDGLRLIGAKPHDIEWLFEPLRRRLMLGSPAEQFCEVVDEHLIGRTDRSSAMRDALASAIDTLGLTQLPDGDFVPSQPQDVRH